MFEESINFSVERFIQVLNTFIDICLHFGERELLSYIINTGIITLAKYNHFDQVMIYIKRGSTVDITMREETWLELFYSYVKHVLFDYTIDANFNRNILRVQ
jgi:hypothetical protein